MLERKETLLVRVRMWPWIPRRQCLLRFSLQALLARIIKLQIIALVVKV